MSAKAAFQALEAGTALQEAQAEAEALQATAEPAVQ